ncbi:unnamed protein product, partial [Arabidopsis halleri]
PKQYPILHKCLTLAKQELPKKFSSTYEFVLRGSILSLGRIAMSPSDLKTPNAHESA